MSSGAEGEDSDGEDGESSVDSAAWDLARDDTTGKVMARDALAGVRVGSAGGWTVRFSRQLFQVSRRKQGLT